CTTEDDVVAAAAVDDVVALATPEGVVVVAAEDSVSVRRAVVDGLTVDADAIDTVDRPVLNGAVRPTQQQLVLVAAGCRRIVVDRARIGDEQRGGRGRTAGRGRGEGQVAQFELAVSRGE